MSKEFEILYNALSVGWHLRKIKEAWPEALEDPEEFRYFLKWLDRHGLKADELEGALEKINIDH